MRYRASLCVPLLLLTAAGPAAQLDNASTPEGWIWQQARAGEFADFNIRCKTDALDPRSPNDQQWRAACRLVDPLILRALLTQPGIADSTPHGVRIRGARIDGNLELSH